MRMTFLLAASALIGAPLAAAKPAQAPERLRQLSEIVFQNYPARALRAGEQGPVYFVVKLDEKAHPTSCQVTHGSGFPLLDAETCDLIVQHATFKSVLGPNGRPTRSVHEGVVNWRIPGTPQPPINPIALTKAQAPEEQICKRIVKTGTLSGFERTCMTQREWELAAKQTQDHWNELQGKKGSTYDCGAGSGVCPGVIPFGTIQPGLSNKN
jgi:TonB family protein